MTTNRITRPIRIALLLALSALLLVNPILFDLGGGGISPAFAAAREIGAVKTELDAAFRQYMDGVKAGSPDAAALHQVYKALLEEYNALKAAEPPAPPAPKASFTVDGFFKNLAAKINPFSSSKTEMSKLEKVLWAVGKALLPTLSVMLFASLAVLPIGWMALGAVLIGGATGGLTNYFYEQRMNKFRGPNDQKSSAEIFRDVMIAGVVDAVMAPLNIVSAGWTGTLIKNASQKMLLKYAVKSGATYFGGRMVSSLAAGGLKSLWYHEILNDDVKVENMEREAQRILSLHSGPGAPPISAEEAQILNSLDGEINKTKANDYNWENLKKDAASALVGAAISGVGGTYLTKLGASSPTCANISMKLFKDTKHVDMVANWMASNPTSFLTGAANAEISKHYLDEDVKELVAKRAAYDAASPVYAYYSGKIAQLEKQRDDINPLAEGAKTMGSNLLLQTGVVGIAALKTNLLDLPNQKKAAIKDGFYADNGDCKSYAEAKKTYEELSAASQTRYQYLKEHGNLVGYTAANRDQLQKLEAARQDMLKKEVLAADAFATAKKTGSDAYQQVTQRVETDLKVQQRLDLARYMGDEATLEAYKYKVSQTPGNERLAPAEIEKLARAEITANYQKRADELAKKLNEAEQKIDKFESIQDQGQAGRGPVSNLAWRRVAAGKTNLEMDEIHAIEYQAGSLAPSTYKSMLVQYQVASMKAGGATDLQIRAASDGIYAQADKVILQAYGDSWFNVVRGEAVANLINRIPFSENGQVNLGEKIANLLTRDVPKKAQEQMINEYRTTLNSEISANVLPVIPLGTQESRKGILEKVKDFFK